MTSEKEAEYGRLEPMLAALEALVRCESPSEDIDACRSVVKLASDIATRVLGVPAQIKEVEGRPVFWWGAENPEVVLLAHLDTVWPIGSYQPIWEINGDVLRGPGTFDMKAGFIQAMYALKGIEGSVALVATTDEETGSRTSKALIQELAAQSKAVLVLEASLDGKVKTGRKGTAMYQIKVHGLAAHAGLEPEKGVNATTEIAHAILALAAIENLDYGTTVVPTLLYSGNTTNTVPDLAVLDIDARSFAQSELERVDQAIRSITPIDPRARLEITGGLNRPPLQPSSTKALYERAEKVAASLGMPPLGCAEVGGASDGNFAAAAGAQVLDGLGAIGGGAHAPNEWVQISSLQQRSDFLHVLIKDLLS
ncbi:MAG: M20/M25/M40 family metallo-hydrolase [Candidatus Planktophila sp.]|jgi:glutamate carboxypeptidase|tara:strand:- start:1255 stop:2355 length:1101 start_codon:yes stop_codon:yes gene_type:complete